MDPVAAKYIGAGLAAIGMGAAAVGVGLIFGNFLSGALPKSIRFTEETK